MSYQKAAANVDKLYVFQAFKSLYTVIAQINAASQSELCKFSASITNRLQNFVVDSSQTT